MTQKVLSEAQMREYVEREVRKALMKGSGENSLLSESINEVLAENMADEGIFDWLQNLFGGAQNKQGGSGVSMEGIIGAILGRFMAPVLSNLLAKVGIDPSGPIGSILVKAASTIGGYKLGQMVDKKWDPIGVDN
jgi:hypothetical protein